MTIYSSSIRYLICSCAEFSVLPLGAVHSPQWNGFLSQVDNFFHYYDLTATPEYQRFSFIRRPQSSFVSVMDSVEKQILQIILDLRKYESTAPKYFDRVFISHSSKDIDIVKPFVKLLESIGLDKSKLFCSSIDGYGIPQRENIYDYLKREFTDKNTFVILMLSDNYYDSKPSLNEMGAAWVMSKEYVSILIKGFEFDKIEGAADKQKIGFHIDDQYRLDEFKENLVKELRINDYTKTWETNKQKFLTTIAEANNNKE